MATTKYSHAFLVGSFNGEIIPQSIDGWSHQVLTADQYADMLSDYYQSHVDAMVEATGQNKPDFLNDVHHYMISFQEKEVNEQGWEIVTKTGEPVDVKIRKGGKDLKYRFSLCNLHLYQYPLGINLVAIEIDDSGVDLDTLTFMHKKLMDWNVNFADIANGNSLTELLAPLGKMLPDGNLAKLVKDGNNFKIYQIVQSEDDAPADKLLFELATFSSIGSAGGTTSNSLSQDYFDKLIRENSVSTYYNWKALALVDSFTVLGGKDFGSWQWINLYFPLIYLRCILEKTFCFSRNNAYRGQKKEEYRTTKELSDEISKMEKYYFYNNFSYNFQPNLVYDAMIKGIGVKEEREQLSKQIRERTKQDEEREKRKEDSRRDLITIGLSIFAVFSIAWDLCSIIKDAYTGDYDHETAFVILWSAIGVILVLAAYIFLIKKHERK